MLQYRSFSRIFCIFYTRKVYRVIPYLQQGKRFPIVRSLAERVIVPCHFLTVPLFLKWKKENHAAIAQVPCIAVLMREH
jgi:hypothetical protein